MPVGNTESTPTPTSLTVGNALQPLLLLLQDDGGGADLLLEEPPLDAALVGVLEVPVDGGVPHDEDRVGGGHQLIQGGDGRVVDAHGQGGAQHGPG